MPDFIDQTGRSIFLNRSPERIVSLVPSQTELLYELGLKEKIVGQTIFCIHPSSDFKASVKIGGTKKLHLDKIVSLNPDLIIANKEENVQEQIEWLARRFPVWISDIYNLEDALQMIQSVGSLTSTEHKANDLTTKIAFNFEQLKAGYDKHKTLYLIWFNPWMAAGRQTFINDILQRVGFDNVLPEHTRYPELNEAQIKDLNPEIILFSSEPFPFKPKHMEQIKSLLPNVRCIPVDGEMFSWYGSRLLKAVDYFVKLQSEIRDCR
jgi:ABC-type Fe3+-hydroxamate transport system substrate-binding protein